MEATRTEPREMQTAQVGDFAAELYAKQGHIDAFFLEIDPVYLMMRCMFLWPG